jgi:hypothetical protein
MGFLDRLFGSDEPQQRQPARSEDEIALERYRYLLRTAPPETIEQVHTEAFAKLTPEQRDLLFAELTQIAPAGDAPKGKDAASLASSATRSELRSPGTLERSMGSQGGGPGFGSMFASSLLGSVAGFVIGSALVSTFMDFGNDGSTDASADSSADAGGYEDGGSDFGGGDFGGDFGGF